MIFNKIFQQTPILAHAPGKIEFIPLWHEINNNSKIEKFECKKQDDLTIVTFNNGNYHNNKPTGTFEFCMSRNNLQYFVLGENIKNWKNKNKIDLLSDFINKIETKYILVADSSDVFLVNSTDTLIDKFLSFNCNCVFNAEKIIWPPDMPKQIENFENSLFKNNYLNAGLWIGKIEFIKTLLKFLKTIKVKTTYKNSEQIYYKYAYLNFYPEIKVDFTSCIFQGLNRVGKDELDIYLSQASCVSL